MLQTRTVPTPPSCLCLKQHPLTNISGHHKHYTNRINGTPHVIQVRTSYSPPTASPYARRPGSELEQDTTDKSTSGRPLKLGCPMPIAQQRVFMQTVRQQASITIITEKQHLLSIGKRGCTGVHSHLYKIPGKPARLHANTHPNPPVSHEGQGSTPVTSEASSEPM